ncbi:MULTISPECIES: DsbC family protein [unclassified Halomonas]|uniref:DsbC family protein n=1 Tax=unclassified Halomonas TaxID=2609666 RepID=UPI000F5E0B95|nr:MULTISPECIES: DsbC family protein [unclassified Halomonas]MCO7216445.1 DsbC family protein [Halomonas sp. OfavH-34-E]RQW69343.1 DsbC family protein [Halomonas sp. YLB-10]
MKRPLFVLSLPALLTAALWTSGALAAPPAALNELEVNGQKMPVSQVLDTPMDGIYEVRLETGESFYTNESGSHFLVGDLYQNAEDGLVNLSEQSRNASRASRVAAINESEQIVYRGVDEPKATIHVFTDTTCPYCRKLHEEVPRLNELGIQVNYLAFPRGGMQSEGARQLEQVWCADNTSEAMTAAKSGEVPSGATSCDNPVERQYHLGLELGVQGTPAIILPDGTMVPGYVPAERLAERLGIDG